MKRHGPLKRTLLTSAVALALPLLAASAASAAETTVATRRYHAAGCLDEGANDSAINRSEYRITNVGAAAKSVLCPYLPATGLAAYSVPGIPGLFYAPVTGTVAKFSINVLDNHATGDISCSAMARNATGDPVQTSVASTSGVPGQKTLDLQLDIVEDRSYVIKCTLPPNSGTSYTRFYGYRVTQVYTP